MRPGFIHDKLDLKCLILYILDRTEEAVDLSVLTDLTLRDDGVDYFTFAEAVNELVESGHVTAEGGLYAITPKGRANSAVMEDSLPGVVRGRCDKALRAFNRQVRRRSQVVAQVVEEPPGRFMVQLGLEEGEGSIFRLALLVPSQARGEEIARRFQTRPEEYFAAITALLTKEDPDAP